MAYTLQYVEHGTAVQKKIEAEVVLIGRSPECTLIFSQPGISRKHCKITIEHGKTYIEDLNSKNGTLVNHVYIRKEELPDESIIQIGNLQVRYRREEAQSQIQQQIVLSAEKLLHKEAGTIIRKVDDVLNAQYDEQGDFNLEESSPNTQNKKILPILVAVAKALLGVDSSQGIMEKVMDLIFEYLPADRGFLMLKDSANDLNPRVIKHRHASKVDSIEISKTIAEMAAEQNLSILTTDAQVDPRFSAGESIRFLGIKSAMCVPLYSKGKAIGIIYLDCPTSAAQFAQIDLDLLTAMANFAAVGIEQAQLTETILRESRIRQRLERYQSPSIVNRILKTPTGEISGQFQLSAQERDVTIIFADIVGFTTMVEKMEPSNVALILNEYFSVMTDIIFNYEGTLDKYIGDAIMAVFGAPNNMEDHPERAVSAGLDMLQALKVLNSERPEECRFSIRIGLNSGKTIAGDIGSIKRMEYTVLGNTVNIASRLESAACSPNQLVIGPETYRRVQHLFECEDLGLFQLKGLTEETRVYRVLKHIE
jgi:adenylate cyclase